MQPKRFLQEQFDDIEAKRAELNQNELVLEDIEQQMEDLIKQLSTILNGLEEFANIEEIKHFQQKIDAVFQEKYSELDS